MNPIVQGIITIIIGVGGCIGYFYFSNLILDRVIFPARGPNISRNINRATQVRPWLFLLPAMAALGLYLVYPVVGSFWRSLFNRAGDEFIGFGNYATLFGSEAFQIAFRNNLLWVLVVPAASTFLGLVVAQLTDRLSWGNVAKSLIFMPMAISFVGASLIWKFVYANDPDIGLINALRADPIGNVILTLIVPLLVLVPILIGAGAGLLFLWRWYSGTRSARTGVRAGTLAGAAVLGLILLLVVLWSASSLIGVVTAERDYSPVDPVQIPFWNNFFLMVILIWIQTGFAMVILSAALRGIPEETVEAAIVDGANPFQIFFQIKVPQVMGTIVVVWTTITILVLKVFDIVYTMTGGNFDTEILPSYMMQFMFRDDGRATAVAFVIMIIVLPVMIWNIVQARKEMR